MKNKRFILITFLILLFIGISALIPSKLINDGVSSLPQDKQKYGEAAIRTAYSGLDNPLQKLMARKLKVMAIDINDKTGEVHSIVSVRSFWGLHYCDIELSGKADPQEYANMGFEKIVIK